MQLNTEQWVSLYGQLQVGNKDVQTFKKTTKDRANKADIKKLKTIYFKSQNVIKWTDNWSSEPMKYQKGNYRLSDKSKVQLNTYITHR